MVYWFRTCHPARRGLRGLVENGGSGPRRGGTDSSAHRGVRRQRRTGCEQIVSMCLKKWGTVVVVGSILSDRYEILERRGEGGMAIVSSVRDRILGQHVRDQSTPAPVRRGYRLRRTLSSRGPGGGQPFPS